MHFLCLQMIFFNLRVLFTSLNTQLTDSKMHCYGVFLALFIFTSGTFIAGSVVIINIIGSLVSISKPFQFNADFRIAKQKSTENGGNKHSRLRSWWWWSNGQRTYLLLRQSKFISGWVYNFYSFKLFKENEKEAGDGPFHFLFFLSKGHNRLTNYNKSFSYFLYFIITIII